MNRNEFMKSLEQHYPDDMNDEQLDALEQLSFKLFDAGYAEDKVDILLANEGLNKLLTSNHDEHKARFLKLSELKQRNAELELLLQTSEQNAREQRHMKSQAREQRDDQVKKNAELEAQLVEVNNNRTGVSPCARFCEALAAKKMFDNLKRENAELMAQVNLFRDFLSDMHSMPTGWTIERSIELHKSTSPQSLAEHDREVAARAVEKVINLCQHSFGSLENAITGSLGVADYELQEYANKIKSGEVQL